MSFMPLVEPGAPLSPDRAARFARHITLPGVGEEGQRRLARARVLVIGAGGLGAPTLQYLAAAGVGHLTVMDDDQVERTNLQRQVLHGDADVGRPKVASARDEILRRDAHAQVTALAERLTPENALDLFRTHDLVLDGSDNFATRYLSNDAAELTGTPLIWGSIHQFAGQVSVFWPGNGPMLRDLYPDIPDAGAIANCATGGVFGVLCGAVGSAMAAEALKLICGIGEPLIGRLARYDALTARWRDLTFTVDPMRPPVTSLEEVAVVCRANTPQGRSDDISAGEVAARLRSDAPGLVVVDVRSPHEQAAGAIEGAYMVPLADIEQQGWPGLAAALGEAATDGPDIVFTCQVGIRSARAIDRLLGQSPEKAPLRNLVGGMNAYLNVAAGGPTQ